jgi:hypothetical protein
LEPVQAIVDRYLAAFRDQDKRLAYLQALEMRMRQDGHQDWVEAIARWRLRQQISKQD